MIDSLKVNNFEKSLFMIKPDSYKYKQEILNELKNNYFELQHVQDVILNRTFLEQLYNSENDEIINLMNIEYLVEKTATIGIVLGENARERLLKICGEQYAPDICDRNTIRYKYSPIRKPILLRGYSFYINAIHRSMPQDSEREIELYMKEYVIKNIERESFNGR